MSRSDPPRRSRQVLVVDDDRSMRGLFSTLLTKKGFDVDTAADGRMAFDQLRRNTYSVILLDLMMPDVNGFELLERLERDSPTLLPRVIVMTGANQRAVETLKTRKIWGLIRKPFDIDNLVKATAACADGKKGLRTED
jgi:DNA-binding response OmpR family regulator